MSAEPDVERPRRWYVCEACGHWQMALPESRLCGACGWSKVLPAIDGDPLNHGFRILVDASLRSDGTWSAAIRAPRLIQLIGATDLISLIENRLARYTSPGHFPSESSWALCRRDIGRDAVQKLASKLDGVDLEKEGFSRPPVSVSFRCALVDRDIVYPPELPRWVVCTPFHEASEVTAQNLDEGGLAVHDISEIGFDERSDKLSLKFKAKHSVVVDGVDVTDSSGDRLLQRFRRTVLAPREETVRITDLQLRAEVIRKMAAPDYVGRLLIRLKGRKQPLPCGVLPHVSQAPHEACTASLFLDLGSTSSKWALELQTGTTVKLTAHLQDSSALTKQLGLDEYRKADVIRADSVAIGNWTKWWADAVPALRYWVGREHGAYLKEVNLSVPVARSSAASRDKPLIATLNEDPPLNTTRRLHLVEPATLRFSPEHELIADHYLAPLRVAEEAALEYVKIVAERADEVEAWNDALDRTRAYKDRPWWKRLFGERPVGPEGRRPEQLPSPTREVESLAERVGQLNRVLILDAGGLSLDVAVVENGVVTAELGHSLGECGGEALSCRIGRKRVGKEGTRYKAQLGLLADASHSDPKQREYREQTQALYGVGLNPIFEQLGKRWQAKRRCIALLTGGGSKNPYFVEMITEMAKSRKLEMWPVDASTLDAIVDACEELVAGIGSDLDARDISRFREVLEWSQKREIHSTASWDQFAVIGGMLYKRDRACQG